MSSQDNKDNKNRLKYLEDNFKNWTSRNKQIDDFIQEVQLKIKNHDDIVFEWVPYNQFVKIKEISKNGFVTTYSAIWEDGPIKKFWWSKEYKRDSNKKVTLNCLCNSQYLIELLINRIKKDLTNDTNKHKDKLKIYGISQNPVTNDYILVQNDFITLINWMSENEKINDLIQGIQLKINNPAFEWIPYNQFDEIKETGKNGFMTIYSSIWKDGPLCKKSQLDEKYTRDPNEEVALKCLHNSQNPIESLISEVKKYCEILKIYGISQNPDTNDYILVQNIWMSGNEKIDNFIYERQLKIKGLSNAIFEWIPYNHFSEIKGIGKGGFSTIYSAIWKNHKVALKCLGDSQNLTNELLNEVKAYSTKATHNNSRILNLYGISQDPDTKNYIIVLQYAEGGSFNNWININENFKNFNWKYKMQTLYYIASGLRELHHKQIVHRDFHTGNILFDSLNSLSSNRVYISVMGLCRKVNDTNQNNIYGVMPYMAPEILRRNPYTKAADIYSFGMIMYFVVAGRQPFDNRAHDHLLVVDICKGIRPVINETEAPESYIDLMKKCWDSNPGNRPDAIELSRSLSFITTNNSEIEKAENYRKICLSSFKGDEQITTHPQAIYTSRLLNSFTENLPKYDDENSECLDWAIINSSDSK